MSTGSTWSLGNWNSVQLNLLGRQIYRTGGSTYTKLVFTHGPRFRSLVKTVSPYGSLTFVQVLLLWCLACCRPSSPRNISLLPTTPTLWKFPSLVYIYHFLSTRIGSSSVEACLVMSSTGVNRAEQCLA